MKIVDRVCVTCTAIAGRLVIGKRSTKDPGLLLEQRDAEDEIKAAIVLHMTHDAPRGASQIMSFDGNTWWQLSVFPVDKPADAAIEKAS